MKKTLAAVAIAATTMVASSAYAVTDQVVTNISATVENAVHVSGISTDWALGTVSSETLRDEPPTLVDNDVQMYTNTTGTAGLDITVNSAKSAPAGTGVTVLPEGQAVIAVGDPDAANPDAMVPITMTCTPCATTDAAPAAAAIQFSPAGNTATGNPATSEESVTADAAGSRTLQIRNGTTGSYTTLSACTTGTGTPATCTFQAGPTTDYEAEGGSYSGTLTQLYSTPT